jgi:hypothetical protein
MRRAYLLGALLAAPLAACSSPAGPGNGSRPNITDACAGNAQPLTLAVGGSTPLWGNSAAGVCLAGGASGAEYVVVAANTATNVAQQLTLNATGLGVEPPTVALTSLAASEPALTLAAAAAQAHRHDDGGFHDRLRQRERDELTARMAPARMQLGVERIEAAVAPVPQIGELISYNVNSRQSCSSPDMRTGRVEWISERAVFVADTANPAPGFSPTNYQELGAVIDTLITPVVTGAFGQSSDVDGNNRIVVFYTRAVNELTPRDATFVVGGFFFARDLYPRSGQGACATSNYAEMFYMLAPDPTGVVNGHRRTVDYVLRATRSTLAHEYQHLINASRRLYVSNAPAFEVIWLDEGLSHIAEELVFFRAADLGPLQNITGPQIQASQRRVDAYNEYQTANVGRFEAFLKAPETSSPWAPNDSLTTRGATWHLLRYAADLRGGDQAQTWRALTAGPATGTANLGAVFGSDLARLHANWATTVVVDDAVTGLHASLSFPSWNMRSIYQALQRPAYPLRIRTLAENTPLETTLAGGGAAYFRVRAPAGSSASVTLHRTDNQALPASFGSTIVRTR